MSSDRGATHRPEDMIWQRFYCKVPVFAVLMEEVASEINTKTRLRAPKAWSRNKNRTQEGNHEDARKVCTHCISRGGNFRCRVYGQPATESRGVISLK
jgi:hypothetical protein